MLLSLPRIISLVLSSTVRVCFAVIFSACTSPTSVQELSLPKIRICGIRNPEHLNELRSLAIHSGQNSSSSLDLGYLSDSVSEAVGDVVDHISGHVEDQPITSDSNQPVLKGYDHISHWSIDAYIISFIAAHVAIVIGFVRFPMTKVAVVISSSVSSLLIVGASVSVTILYQLLAKGIDRLLQHEITAHLGPHAMAATWLAVAFSAGSNLVLAIEMCSCCL
ncbi:hypothetical protein BDQ94DRAFT_164635 [Aspergillus welwitschiae]|uniref:Uncharacterized protein n=1 Tax=Aspergillus welwitschiae TaxID=1341132 RepID=A0A3F3PHN5_9EURO|nr:hypothetical protein BDQ94DRAFT_164635 [Aspergillus welwitschiae]RDH26253.1 hypothetical protein BDQ94DRAFT_164635 [Aspergillus welwitschiae]